MKILITTFTLLLSVMAFGQATDEHPDRANPVDQYYNLEEGDLGLKGYDPVAYFTDQKARKGKKSIEVEYGHVVYRFVSEDNADEFLLNPTKYEPTYGGWCAWAMANNAYADINPKLFTQHENRMHFFISRGAKARFDRNVKRNEKRADSYWKSESGESARK